MLEFKRLGLEDRELFLKHLGDYPFKTYEYSFTTLYLWREFCDAQFSTWGDTLIVCKTCRRAGVYFMQPVGYRASDLPGIVDHLMEIKATDYRMKYLFCDVEESFLNELIEIYGDRVVYSEDVDNFDYVYESKDLISLSGKHLHAKKNHYNRFIKTYAYRTRDIREPGVIADCLDFAHTWFENHGESSDQLRAERAGIKDVLDNFDSLGLDGMAVYVDDRIVGFTIGEKVNDEMAIIHVEKADPQYDGVYAFINKAFAEQYYRGVRYINREEDLGIEGLRKAKASYHPVKLEKKYLVNIA